jgi:hypothetical protein
MDTWTQNRNCITKRVIVQLQFTASSKTRQRCWKHLKTGSFSKTGEKLSGQWNTRLATARDGNNDTVFLRNSSLPGPIQRYRLNVWFKNSKRKIREPVFTRTRKRSQREKKRSTILPTSLAWIHVSRDPARTKINNTWACQNGGATETRPPLEKFQYELLLILATWHEQRQDTLTLGEPPIQHQNALESKMNKRKLAGAIVTSPVISSTYLAFSTTSTWTIWTTLRENFVALHPFRRRPSHWQEQRREVYLSKYFENKWLEIRRSDKTRRHPCVCLCPACTTYLLVENTQITRFQHEDNDNDNNDASTICYLWCLLRHHPFFRKPPPSTPVSFGLPSLPLLTQLVYAGGWLRPEMIAATWSEILLRKLWFVLAKNQRRANLASHRTIRCLVLSDGSSDGMSSVSDEINYSTHTIT